MRVRISYGMEIEEVPEQAENLGHSAQFELKQACSVLTKALENIEEANGDYNLILEMFDKVRKKLNKADLIMGDVEAILIGLNNYYNGEQDVSEGRSTVDTSGNTNEQTKNPGQG